MNSSNLYKVSGIFNISCADEEYDDFNISDLHDDTKAVFLNYIKETFWDRDLALVIDSKLEKIDNKYYWTMLDANIKNGFNICLIPNIIGIPRIIDCNDAILLLLLLL
jgi:hypothetical protein